MMIAEFGFQTVKTYLAHCCKGYCSNYCSAFRYC